MKKTFGSILCMLVAILVLVSTVSAFDIRYTDYTYARDSHPNIAYFEGFVGVRGADWIKQSIYWNYPVYSKVSFDVPMFPTQTVQVTSSGLNDTNALSDSIRVYDNPLPLEKTKSYWNIRLEIRPLPWPDGSNQ